MVYTCEYESPLGRITIAASEDAITGLWFIGQKYYGQGLPKKRIEKTTPLLEEARRWLDLYFSGKEPDFLPPLQYGSTPFRRQVCQIMLTIPYGHTMTYKAIAEEAAMRLRKENMALQAVGGAVGHNPITLMIPCHRVVGTDGSLTGYAGGIERKVALLELEKADMTGLYVPKEKSAASRHRVESLRC
ncbi:methylated-DNA--[protein]-cysteine S-methyltransferase [Dialister sp.]|jgi:methylated-DNA-[protein]-cysteine S-methyltransferase|uniref:methylated-DNA--[protein]-cysteine S-methyltransferase n=1 Tax=Dialister sp. TaxID=1955814 RepID=UPI003A5B9DBE